MFDAYELFNFNFVLLVIEKDVVITTNLTNPESASGILASKSRIYRFYNKKVVVSHPGCRNLEMWKLLVILVV